MNRPSFSLKLLHFIMTGLPAEDEKTQRNCVSDIRHLRTFSSGTASLQCSLCSGMLVRTSSVPCVVRKKCLLPHVSGNPEDSRRAGFSSPVSRQTLFRLKGRKWGPMCLFCGNSVRQQRNRMDNSPLELKSRGCEPSAIGEGVGRRLLHGSSF